MGDLFQQIKDAIWDPSSKKAGLATGSGGADRKRTVDSLVDAAVNGSESVDVAGRQRKAQSTDSSNY